MIRRVVLAAVALFWPAALFAQRAIYDSGGPLPAEQAAYDLGFYDLALRVDPATKTIRGSLAAFARAVDPLRHPRYAVG